MTPNENPDAGKPDLELEVGVGVPVELKQLVSASETFAALINEVAREYTGAPRTVRWIVEVAPGSVRLPVRAEPATDEVSPAAVHELPHWIAEGLAHLEREPTRPEYFSDKALEEARDLANMAKADFPVALRNGGERLGLSQQLAVNAAKVLGKPRTSFGTVEGRLESLSVHGGNEFSIWRVDGARVKCQFGKYLRLDDVLPTVGKRVAARGSVKTHPRTGKPESVEVRSLRVLGDRATPADDVRGIFEGRKSVED